MLEYRYKVRNGQNKSWEDKSSPRQRTRIFLQKTREDLEMIELIISILVPILGGLGVSEADVTTCNKLQRIYLCNPYFYFSIDCIISSCTFYCTKRKKTLSSLGSFLSMGTRTCDHGKHGLLRPALHKPFRCIKRWRNSIR